MDSAKTTRLTRLEAHLRARIARRHEVVSQIICIGALAIPFTRIKTPDAVLDQIIEQEDHRERLSGVRRPDDDLHLPYWAELWDSALGVGQYLCERTSDPTQDSRRRVGSVLDLGCGMGLAGTVAAALGFDVLLVDLEPPALLFARLNTLPFSDRVRIRQLDWRSDRLDEKFDLILGSDLLYERKQWEFLEPFWRNHIAPDGSVILGEPGRQTGDMFPSWIVTRRWTLEVSEQPVPTRERPIRIFRLSHSPREVKGPA